MRAAVTCRGFSQNYTAAALAIFGFGFETTNRKEGRRRLGLTARTQRSLKGFAPHGGHVAIVVKKDFVAAKLTGGDPPTAAENLKLLLTLNAEADSEAFYPTANSLAKGA